MHPERFTATGILWEHADELSRFYFRMKGAPGTYVATPADMVLIGNFAGTMNKARDAVISEQPAILAPYGQGAGGDIAGRDCLLGPGSGVSLLVNGPARLAARVADGVKVFVSYSQTPGEYHEGSASASNGAANIDAPAGQWYANMKLGDGMTWSGTANLFAGAA